MPDVKVGDKVVGLVGRIHNSSAIVEDIARVPLLMGGTVTILKLRRPRAGVTYAFPSDVRLATDEAPAKPDLPEPSFG